MLIEIAQKNVSDKTPTSCRCIFVSILLAYVNHKLKYYGIEVINIFIQWKKNRMTKSCKKFA